MKTGMQPAIIVSLRRRVLAESPGIDRQNVALRMRPIMLLHGWHYIPQCMAYIPQHPIGKLIGQYEEHALNQGVDQSHVSRRMQALRPRSVKSLQS